jgi:ABC-2 type transport system ATP-binding protein
LAALAAALRQCDGVEQVVPFGNTLHVTGTDAAALGAATAPWRSRGDQQWRPVRSGLEDVFISLLQRYRGDSP